MKILFLALAAASPAFGRLHDNARRLQAAEDNCPSITPDPSCWDIDGLPLCCQTGRCPIDVTPPCEIILEEVLEESTTTTSTTTTPVVDTTTSTTSTFTTTTTTTTTTTVEEIEPTQPDGIDPVTLGPPTEPNVSPGPPYCQVSDTACYASGKPTCCEIDPSSCDAAVSPPCDVGNTPPTTISEPPVELPYFNGTELPELTLPEGGLRACNTVIATDYPDNIIPKQVILAIMEGVAATLVGSDSPLIEVVKQSMQGMVTYDVRAKKICSSCEEANALWGESASDVMPYCRIGTFQYGRTMSGLLLEPIDSETKEPIVGKVASTIYNFATEPDPFLAKSETWPSNPALERTGTIGALGTATAGTYTIVPDVLGNGEDWQSLRSYMVKDLYQASAVPLLLKVKDDIEKNYSCTELDKRVSIFGFSEGGYATIAVAHAIDELNDGYVHTYTGVGGAPIKWSTEQLKAVVEFYENTYPRPYSMFAARLGNSYSSTTNGDHANAGAEDFAAEEYLDPENELKNVVAWAEAGLGNQALVTLGPNPAAGQRFSDVINPNFVDLVVKSYDAGNRDPCNSKFMTESVEKLCQSVKNNDLSDILMNQIDYPVVICHSPDDELIYFDNVPNTAEYEHLTMIEDVPFISDLVQPSGTHVQSGGQCLLGFIFPYVGDTATSPIRNIAPLDDPDEACFTSTSSTKPDIGVTTTSSPTQSPTTSAAFGMSSFGGVAMLAVLASAVLAW